jgi:hypothetical protein
MAGMSRDKCGAADVAGFFKIVSILKPKNVKVRNNILILYKFCIYSICKKLLSCS